MRKPADALSLMSQMIWSLHACGRIYRVVVFVLQVPSVDRTLGCGVWRLWCCWSVQYFSLNLTDNPYDYCQYNCKLWQVPCQGALHIYKSITPTI